MLNVEEQGAIAVVRFDRPPANAMNSEFFASLRATLDRLERSAARAVVVTGSGRFFSAGLDLFEVFAQSDADFAEFTRHFDEGFRAAFAFPKPLVAAVNGHAVAGGAVLAACADHRLIAAGEGQSGLTELQVGVAFPVTAFEIVRHGCAGRHLAEILQQARTYPPEQAVERGLGDEVVPAAELLDRARALAGELGAVLPSAFAETKRALRADTMARMQAVAPGTDPVWRLWRSAEVQASLEAYRSRALRKQR